MSTDGSNETVGRARMQRAGKREVEAALTSPGTHILFLHDPWCPISDRANEQMERVDYPIFVVDVSSERGLSKLIAERTKVRHESPQVFVLADGAVKWHASHGRITRQSVTNALSTPGE